MKKLLSVRELGAAIFGEAITGPMLQRRRDAVGRVADACNIARKYLDDVLMGRVVADEKLLTTLERIAENDSKGVTNAK